MEMACTVKSLEDSHERPLRERRDLMFTEDVL